MYAYNNSITFPTYTVLRRAVHNNTTTGKYKLITFIKKLYYINKPFQNSMLYKCVQHTKQIYCTQLSL